MTEQASERAPKAQRPYMPDYGITASERGLLSWNWARSRLANSRHYWLASVRSDGGPHLVPVWGVWVEGAFFFSTGAGSRKAKNLQANPRFVISAEDAVQPVIVEGSAERVTDLDLLGRVAAVFSSKYGWPIEATADGVRDAHGNGGPVFAIHPAVAFGFGEDLAGTATRWAFDA